MSNIISPESLLQMAVIDLSKFLLKMDIADMMMKALPGVKLKQCLDLVNVHAP